MNADFRIWIAGQGGQGVSFLSQLLCRAAYLEQRHVTARSDQEWAIRGGRTLSWVLIHEAPFSPALQADFNWALILHPGVRQLLPPLAPEARILDAYELKLYQVTDQVRFQQGLNMVLLGVLLALSQVCRSDTVVWQLRHLLGKEQVSVLPYNLELLERGLELGQALSAQPEH